jgi:glyoxylase-like metal-dependent hydrolase (beta-lactamase superfamily II)
MADKRYRPIQISPHFYLLGTPAYSAYLSIGEYAMIIEGGIAATSNLILQQIHELDIAPERIKYLVLTHTHPDHIGAVPIIKKLWPHVQVVGGAVAAKLLQSEGMVKEYVKLESVISEILLIKNEIEEWPIVLENPVFKVDKIVKEGDKIDLGAGITWDVYETPGHSPCHMSYYNSNEKIVIVGDASGLYDFERYVFWPNYFDSLEVYCNSIRKLHALPAQLGALSHNGNIHGNVHYHFQKAMKATEAFHNEMLLRVKNGEDPRKVTFDLARRAFTFTNMQPFENIYGLTRLMLKKSQEAADKPDLFKLT